MFTPTLIFGRKTHIDIISIFIFRCIRYGVNFLKYVKKLKKSSIIAIQRDIYLAITSSSFIPIFPS